MSARILLPVKAHVKKYLEVQYGKEMDLNDRGIMALLVRSLLRHHKKQDPATVRPSQKLIDNKKYFPYPVYIGDKIVRSNGLYLDNETIKKFNESVDDAIREEMFWWCQHPGSIDHIVDFDIVRFRDKYNMTEDDLPFDNLKKWYYRERKRLLDRGRIEKRFEPQLELSY
jgi:hypothetical protein